MSGRNIKSIFLYLVGLQCIILLVPVSGAQAQNYTAKGDSVTMPAGKQYEKSSFHNFFFGKHYREDWVTPVKLPVMYLDTLAGGITPYETGGGRQSRTLKLRDKDGREYVLRSIDKTYGNAIPEIYRGSFVESIADDQVSSAQPYASVTVPGMAKAAGVYHTYPIIGFVPKKTLPDSLAENGDAFYLFEQRPDENWETADNFGNPKNIVSTEKMFKELQENNKASVDYKQYIRSRLFDMFIGDWGRHEDQWRWGEFKTGGYIVYKPIPRDRDQIYTRFDGLLTRFGNYGPLQTFDYDIKKLQKFNFPARDLDRRIANEATLDDWVTPAYELQKLLTDEIIETNVKKLPPEIYAISGREIADKLKSRRGHLHEYAQDYYRFIAREVDIPTTEEREYFKITRLSNEETLVEIWAMNKAGEIAPQPFYSRTFKADETKEIRLYGISGKDKYLVEGHVDKGIKLRLIGGTDRDTIADYSVIKRSTPKTLVYDNPDTYIEASYNETITHESDDTSINAYNYRMFKYDKRGFSPLLFYSNEDRIHVGIGYKLKKYKWRKQPNFYEQSLFFKYSLSQNAIGATYKGTFHQLVGKWNLETIADYDAVRWSNFFGFGNETKRLPEADRNFYRVRTHEMLMSAGLRRPFGRHSDVKILGFLQTIKLIEDEGRITDQTYIPDKLHLYERLFYAGGNLNYAFVDIDDDIVPIKGVGIFGGATYTHNIERTAKSFARYDGSAQIFVPLIGKFSLAVVAGGSTITGNPEFYQYPSIGGSRNFRGLMRDRFRGNTSFYNNNELRWITDVRSKIMNGKAGFVALVDDGRVWYEDETSDKIHVAYGGGVLLAPFNMFRATLTYAVSDEGGRISIRLARDLNPYN